MSRLLLLTLLATTALPAQELTPADEPIVKVVAKVRPAVVNIYTLAVVQQAVRDPYDQFFDRFFGGGSMGRGNRIVNVPLRSLGSGVLVDPSGFIVTNHHVADRANNAEIKVTLEDQTTYDAEFVRSDPDLDLALIRIKRDKPFPYIPLDRTSPNLLGQTVIVIGNPVGYESSVSRGILSAKERSITVGDTTYENLLQTDAAINLGNSGGALVDINGRLVGISSAKLGASPSSQGPLPVENIGFAIPADTARAFANESIDIALGRKPEPPPPDLAASLRAKLGLGVQNLTPDLAASFGLGTLSGYLLVNHVEPGSPAAEAGIEKGMLLSGLNGARVRSLADLPRQLAKLKTGDSLRLTLRLFQRRGPYLLSRNAVLTLKAT